MFAPLSEAAKLALQNATGGAAIAGSLGVVALLLAIIGVGGVFSYLVEEQRREIGIRLALGGSRAQIAAALARACRGAVVGGLAAGLMLSVAAGITSAKLSFRTAPSGSDQLCGSRGWCSSLRRSSRQRCRSVARFGSIRP